MKKINKVLGVIAIAFTGMLLSSCDNKTMSTATTSSSVEQNVEDDIYFGQDRVELEQDTPKFQGFYVEGDDDFNFNNTYIDYHNVQSIKYYCYLTEFNKEVGLHEGVITYYNIKYPITYRVIAKDEIKDKKIIFKNDVRFKESTYYFFDTKPLIYVETYDGFKGVMPIDNELLGMVDRTPGIHKKIIYYKNTGFELKYTTHGNVAFVYNSLGRNSFYPYEDLRDIYENGRIFVIYDDGYTETYDLRQCSFGYNPANVTPGVHTGYISSILDNFKFYYRIKAPTKVELIKNGDSIFYEGDLDSTYDLILHCTYDTGIEYDVKVDSSMISNFSLNEAGNHTATITFGSFQFKYDYTVISNKIVSGTVSEAMNAHRMYTTDPICFDVVFTRENGKKSTLTIYDYEITGFDYTPGSHSVVSCHNGVELRFDYEIDDPTPLSVKLNTIYYVGVSNNRRLVLDVVYDGGYKTKHTVYLDELIDLSKLDLSAGAHTITLKYKGIDFEYTYDI